MGAILESICPDKMNDTDTAEIPINVKNDKKSNAEGHPAV